MATLQLVHPPMVASVPNQDKEDCIWVELWLPYVVHHYYIHYSVQNLWILVGPLNSNTADCGMGWWWQCGAWLKLKSTCCYKTRAPV